jgi:dTDP-4-amino-4,6-dideoxygalactose transaminase
MNIGSSVHFIPLHLHPFYRQNFGYQPGDFPMAAAVYQRIVSLPIYPNMTDADVDDVIGAVRSIVGRHRR